jgi:hypothetical protein
MSRQDDFDDIYSQDYPQEIFARTAIEWLIYSDESSSSAEEDRKIEIAKTIALAGINENLNRLIRVIAGMGNHGTP